MVDPQIEEVKIVGVLAKRENKIQYFQLETLFYLTFFLFNENAEKAMIYVSGNVIR